MLLFLNVASVGCCALGDGVPNCAQMLSVAVSGLVMPRAEETDYKPLSWGILIELV